MPEFNENRWSQEALEIVDQMCLFDDDFMSLCFERNKEATEYLINTILERDDLEVIDVQGQKEYKNPYFGGRSIRMDIFAKDSSGKTYDIEVQRSNAGAVPQRSRFNSAMMDVRMLESGQEMKELRDSYVIFITQNDVIGDGLPLYHAERIITENSKPLEDGSHIIYVNGAYKNDDNPIGRLVHDFGCVRSADIYNDLLRKQVSYFKDTEGGRTEMCELLENYALKRFEAEREEIRLNVLAESVRNLTNTMKIPANQIVEGMKLSTSDQAAILKKLQ